VREAWNEHSVIKHCQKTGNRWYLVPAYDIDKKTNQELPMEARLAAVKASLVQTEKLADRVEVAIGMKAMVVLNLSTEAEVANGTRGVIHDIILDEREEPHSDQKNGTVKLQYPPAMILFKPDRETTIRFPGIELGLIPITPSEVSFTVEAESGRKYRLGRQQYAMTPGYAFTDYKSQGQTIEYVIIDLGKPPTGQLSPFGAYVALSRSRGRDTIRLLRVFDEELFQHHPSEALRLEMERLEALNREGKEQWKKRNML
jgi:ATP-dependent exoDNAse (exonuclease V) alpha subunit